MRSELIVLSHLRWDWVWQRPQQLVSRLSSASDRRTWFIEEPQSPPDGEIASNRFVSKDVGGITRAWLEIPDPGHHVGFSDDVLPQYVEHLPELVGPPGCERVVWIYTPLALEAALALQPTTIVYDVMDDLAAFKGAAPELVVRQRQALRRADVVFAGGRSLHRSVVRQGRTDAVLLPSGVSVADYAPSQHRAKNPRPVAGFVGVLDERLDVELLRRFAEAVPDWEVRMVGPVAKIDPATLPQGPNITYLGMQPYSMLPQHMASFDVAIMPFALNEATRSISPTKTLEYLASGLPVVSTRIPDVVADFPGVVDLQDDAEGFADACARLRGRAGTISEQVRRILQRNDWDTIATRMERMLFPARSDGSEPAATA
jgi:glycosyltransferase involved in cell wall biosynthesis